MHYFVSGLHLQTNEPLAGLISHTVNSQVDTEIRSGTLPGLEKLFATQRSWYVSSSLDENGQPVLTISTSGDGAYFRMVYFDGNEFLVDRCGTQVWVNWSNSVTADDKTSFLVGPVLSFVLCLRGVTCLHASAVSIAGQAIAFVGPEGAGKSTMAAAFARRSCPVLADDIIALRVSNKTFLAQPGYPRLRLRPGGVSALYDTTPNSPRLLPTEDRQYFDLDLSQDGYKFEQQALPLRAMYFLAEPRADVFAPAVDAMTGSEALITLIANTWATQQLDRSMRAREFETLSRLSAKVPLRCVRTSVRRSPPDTLREIILDDFRKISADLAAGQSRGF